MYFKPYGGVRWSQEPGGTGPDSDSATRRSYTGQYEETSQLLGSLMHYKARYYSPFLHRFTQPDTVLPGAGNPQNINRHSYVNNNTINYKDPTGHCATGMVWDSAVCTLALSSNPVGWIILGVVAVIVLAVTLEAANSVEGGYYPNPAQVPNVPVGTLPYPVGDQPADMSTTFPSGSTTITSRTNVPGGVDLGVGVQSGSTTFPIPQVAVPGSNMVMSGQLADNNVRTTDHFWDRVRDAGITEDDAWDVYQNGQTWTDERGSQIRWDPKRGIGVVVDILDGGAVGVLDQVTRPRGWEKGWGIDRDYLEPDP